MMLEKALALLHANDRAEIGTFLHALHEEGRFDLDGFWALCNAAVIVGASPAREERAVRQATYHLYGYCLGALIWHFCPGDASRIADLPDDLSGHVDALAWAFSGILSGEGRDWSRPPIDNPQADALRAYFES